MTDDDANLLISEMQAVKKLMMLQLLALGYKQKNLAAVLGLSDATISRMLPKGSTKETPKISGLEG